MKKVVLTLSVAIASLLAGGAFAQTKGEADPEQSKAAPSQKATKAEKLKAKQERTTKGKEVAKKYEGVTDSPSSAGVAKTSSVEERKAAAIKRKAAAADAVKKGETTSGEK